MYAPGALHKYVTASYACDFNVHWMALTTIDWWLCLNSLCRRFIQFFYESECIIAEVASVRIRFRQLAAHVTAQGLTYCDTCAFRRSPLTSTKSCPRSWTGRTA